MTGGFAIGWRQVVAAFLLMGTMAMIASSYSVLAVSFAQEFDKPRSVLLLAMTALSLISGLLSPFLGILMDRVSLRLIMLLGSFFLAAGYVLLSFAGSFYQVIAVFGLVMAPANVLLGPTAGTVLISRWFFSRRGRAMGVAIAGISLGSAVFPPLMQWLFDLFEWRGGLRVLSLILLAVTVPAALMVVSHPSERGLQPDGAQELPEQAALTASGDAAAPRVSAWSIFADPAFWLTVLLIGLVSAGLKGMVTNLSPLAIDEGIAPVRAALLISVFAGSGFVAKLIFAGVADRLGLRVLLVLMLVGFSAGNALMTQAEAGFWTIAAAVAMIGLFGGMALPIQSLLVPRVFGEKIVGRVMGSLSFVMLLILLASPPLFGLIYDLTGDYDGIFIAFSGLALAALLAALTIRLGGKRPKHTTAVPA
ncbi:MAG: MFS transporter [Novosphingobium sp.]